MDAISINALASIAGGKLLQGEESLMVSTVSIDSRQIGNNSVFFALKGTKTDGHQYVSAAFANGAVAAVVSTSERDKAGWPDSHALIEVADPLAALQQLAAWWRGKLSGKVIAITGSNGKTIVKDLLIQALSGKYAVSGSPGSQNSQLGVPLSVARLPMNVDFSVMEAGVSEPGDMDSLETILRPNYGILTNIGMAHIAAFGNQKQIALEKIKLFKHIPENGWVLAPDNARHFYGNSHNLRCPVYSFGIPSGELPFVQKQELKGKETLLSIRFPQGNTQDILINTPSREIISDIEVAICAAYLLGVSDSKIAELLSGYEPSHTRMEIWRSPIGTILINDSCSADPMSVQAALRSLEAIGSEMGKKIFVFGGMRELGERAYREHYQIGEMAAKSSVGLMVLVGGAYLDATEKAFLQNKPKGSVLRCADTEELEKKLPVMLDPQDTVLFKGPRNTGIDRVAQELTGVIAPDRFIVDLQAVTENILHFRRKVGPKVKILGMVKALAYGSNLVRLSREMQNIGLDYLGVSTPDEGVTLRKAGVTLPILVMICTPDEANKVVESQLTPVIYSTALIPVLIHAAKKAGREIPVHLKVDTGMGRLGVLPEQVEGVIQRVIQSGSLKLEGLMTHFACAEDPAKDSFTEEQIGLFKKIISEVQDLGVKEIICHAAATSGAARFPESHFDMVRIGLGLYGIYPSPAVSESIELELAVSLVSRIAEVRFLNKGHIIGYGATFQVPRDNFRAGVVPIGYHDGLPLTLSNKGQVMVNGKLAPIVGRISMDSMIIDLGHIPDAQPGTDVLIYGSYGGHIRRPEAVAEEAGTIPYELLTRLGPRIQRIYLGY